MPPAIAAVAADSVIRNVWFPFYVSTLKLAYIFSSFHFYSLRMEQPSFVPIKLQTEHSDQTDKVKWILYTMVPAI